jgi:hypothetical protein
LRQQLDYQKSYLSKGMIIVLSIVFAGCAIIDLTRDHPVLRKPLPIIGVLIIAFIFYLEWHKQAVEYDADYIYYKPTFSKVCQEIPLEQVQSLRQVFNLNRRIGFEFIDTYKLEYKESGLSKFIKFDCPLTTWGEKRLKQFIKLVQEKNPEFIVSHF